jgi:hypothetical protein
MSLSDKEAYIFCNTALASSYFPDAVCEYLNNILPISLPNLIKVCNSTEQY